MSENLNNTIGAAFIGTVAAAALLGVSWVQTLYYFKHQNDSWYIKSTVISVIFLDTLHQILISHAVYTYVVTDWGNPHQLQLIVWSMLAEALSSAFLAFIVQSFFILRIWRLSRGNIYITSICAILTIGGLVTLLVYVAKAFKLTGYAEAFKIKGESISVNTLGAANDVIIAVTLCIILGLSRTGFKKSDVIIKKLIIFTVNTGLITSLCAIASLISILVAPNTFIYIGFFFSLSRLYTNSLLATLNARGIIAGSFAQEEMGESMSLPLQNLHRNTITNQHPNVSIKIDTTHGLGYPHQKVSNDSSGTVEGT